MRSFSQSGLQLAGIVVTFQGEDCSRLSVRTGGGKQCWRMQKVCQNVPSVCDNIGAGRHCKPVLHPIPVQKPFQVLEVDVMDLPATEKCNGYVVVNTRFIHEVAHGISSAGSESLQNRSTSCRRVCSTLRSSRVTVV